MSRSIENQRAKALALLMETLDYMEWVDVADDIAFENAIVKVQEAIDFLEEEEE